jgi:hypothetical protein
MVSNRATPNESVATRYNGILFRSRLEARWAVFLNEAGIAFDYERYFIRARNGTYRGVPDFTLPGRLPFFAEAKGFAPPEIFARLLALARVVSAGVVVLGHIPGPTDSRWPCVLMSKPNVGRELFATPWTPFGPRSPRQILEPDITAELVLKGFPVTPPEWADEPLNRARWHRFPKTDGPQDFRALYH